MSRFRNTVNSLLYRIQKGDKSKQRELFESTYNYLKVIALKYAVNKNDYEDILSEAYLRAFRYASTADVDKDGYNWLCKIVQNVAYDFNSGTLPTVPLDEISFGNILGDDIDRIISKDELLKELSRLPEYEQRLIHLRFYENMTYVEMAKALNSKKSTVHRQVSKILAKLGKIFK